MSNLTNPKAAVFFSSLLPEFAVRESRPFLTMLVLGAVFCLMTLTWLSAYAFAIARLANVFERPRVRRALSVVTGTALVAFGLQLALEER